MRSICLKKLIFLILFLLLVSAPVALAAATKLVFVRGGNIWLANADGTGARQLTSSGQDRQPALSPDGLWVAFTSGRGKDSGFGQIFLVPASGGEVKAFRPHGMAAAENPFFSPDGKSLLFVGLSHLIVQKTTDDEQAQATMSVSLANLQGDQVRQIIRHPDTALDFGYIYAAPALSPDGCLVAYQQSGSDVSGGFGVLDLKGEKIFRFPVDPKEVTPYWRPSFSADGKEILCYSPGITEDQADLIYLVDLATKNKRLIAEGSKPTFVEGGTAIVFERRPAEHRLLGEDQAKTDLWRLELAKGAKPRKIINDGAQPAGQSSGHG